MAIDTSTKNMNAIIYIQITHTGIEMKRRVKTS